MTQRSRAQRKPNGRLRRGKQPAFVPVSYAQRRLWCVDQFGAGRSTQYHMPHAVRLRAALDLDALHRAVNTIVARHESLRTHFA